MSRGEYDKLRSAADAYAMLEKVPEVEDVAPEVIVEGKTLLDAVALQYGKRVMGEDDLRTLLTEMIKGTPFQEATVTHYLTEGIKLEDTFANLFAIFGEYLSGNAYNVWFARDKAGHWILYYSRVPKNGNLRS